MTRPLGPRSTERKIAAAAASIESLARRPQLPAAAGTFEASWIRLERDVNVTLPSGSLVNPFPADASTSWQESGNLDGAMEVDTATVNSTTKYVIRILLPGLYIARCIFDVVTLSALTVVRPNIEWAVLQETWSPANQFYAYLENISSFGSHASVHDSAVVTDADITASDAVNVNYVHPRVRQESGSDKEISSARFMISRIPIAGPVS